MWKKLRSSHALWLWSDQLALMGFFLWIFSCVRQHVIFLHVLVHLKLLLVWEEIRHFELPYFLLLFQRFYKKIFTQINFFMSSYSSCTWRVCLLPPPVVLLHNIGAEIHLHEPKLLIQNKSWRTFECLS